MEPLTLASDELTAVIAEPGTRYRGSRFDWTTQLHELSWRGGPNLLTQEKESVDSPADQGWGLAGEFGIATPIGYDDCPVGEAFSKIGVGLLTRSDDKPYRFNRAYDLTPARFSVKSAGRTSVYIQADQANVRGYSWLLKRHWSVRGPELSLTTTLANTGSRVLRTEEYIHNFFGLGTPVGSGWRMTLPVNWAPSAAAELVDPEVLLEFRGPHLGWRTAPTRDFFLSDLRQPAPQTWSLSQSDLGLTVTETVDFAPSGFNLWGRGHVVSPELYFPVEVAPGGSLDWTRRWTFRSEARL